MVRPVSQQLSNVTQDLNAAQRGLKLGFEESLRKFDTRSAAHLFSSFSLQMNLFGADSGQKFIDDHKAQIGSLPPAQQKAFVDLLSDHREVAALQEEARRLSGLQGLERLFVQVLERPSSSPAAAASALHRS